jgi:hypothetical protein
MEKIKRFIKKKQVLVIVITGSILTILFVKKKDLVLALPVSRSLPSVEKEIAKTVAVETDPANSKTKKWIQRGRTICCVGLSLSGGLLGANPAYLPNTILGGCCAFFMTTYTTLGIVQRWRGENTNPEG